MIPNPPEVVSLVDLLAVSHDDDDQDYQPLVLTAEPVV